ncbi:tetratricopeptide repeat protein [Thalassoglobus polymorphus]|uniref:Tetratricopeptide repeat protein n=1 Tax=Thalassoglobus polymorphus TaxID=2527994 RepID=A0A517QIW3_9PLAN|nr:tetratricopeptide repeat protein [Thalassoglobus polymorphus]QDT31548.1 Tetratricopeptide repeat protein [Thalassoglobus polymorphus]
MADDNQKAAKCFQAGNKAMEGNNWDMAVQMFSQCVKLVPHNLGYRQLLRNCTKKKYGDNKKGAGGLTMTKLMSIRSKVKKAKQKELWEEADKLAEQGLLLNPWDAQLNVDVAEAAKALDRGEIARFGYAEAVKAAQKDKAIHLALAEHLENRGEYTEARKIWERIKVIDPKDIEVSRKLSALDAMQATRAGNFDEAESSKDVKRNKGADKSQSIEQKSTDLETSLRHEIRRNPEQVEHYLKLGAHLRTAKKFQDSYDILKQALDVSAGDPGVREQLEDAELLLLKHNVDLAKENADKSEDPEARKQVAALSKDLRTRRIEVLSAREERHPQNLGIKMELAKLVMQLQEWSRAIPLLQKASQDPRLKTKALVLLGKCFMYDNKLPLAKGQFERAVPDLNHDTDPDTYKESHYLLARVCEETGDSEKAVHHYGEVLVVDYDYKDARERLEKLQGG